MGDEIRTSSFSAADFAQFQTELQNETALLKSWFDAQQFSQHPPRAGFELEAWLVDEHFQPAPLNQEFLRRLNSPLASPELASFNVEVNSTPRNLAAHVFYDMHEELNQTWRHCRDTAADMQSQIIMIGILPTLNNEVLTLANMSRMERYRALNREVLHMRKGKPLVFDINGVEHLRVTHRDVMMESAATSFQIHLQLTLQNSVAYFNAAQALTGPMVALSANSPFLFGKDLWDETRIPVFEQAVAVGGYAGAAFGPIRRVTFGHGYIRQSLYECFQENLEHYPVMLPVALDASAQQLPHLRLHNGTIWRWNRPLLGFDDDGQAHLRLEHRVVPAGPTTIDAIANAAFFYGAVTRLAELPLPVEKWLPFNNARDNFYAAARHGLRATQTWQGGKQLVARNLILNELLPMAAQGLKTLGVAAADSECYLNIIQARVTSGMNGAAWQRAHVNKYGRDMRALTEAYAENQDRAIPVHEWSI